MEIFKDVFAAHNPDWYFLNSRANESTADLDIKSMGEKLAEEVKDYITKHFPNPVFLGRLTFLGHSLGGLVIRSALPLLEEYKEKMWCLITFSSPHLGCMFSENKLISAGLWMLKTWYSSKCLEQLSFSDKTSITECFLYKLAMGKVIQ